MNFTHDPLVFRFARIQRNQKFQISKFPRKSTKKRQFFLHFESVMLTAVMQIRRLFYLGWLSPFFWKAAKSAEFRKGMQYSLAFYWGAFMKWWPVRKAGGRFSFSSKASSTSPSWKPSNALSNMMAPSRPAGFKCTQHSTSMQTPLIMLLIQQ